MNKNSCVMVMLGIWAAMASTIYVSPSGNDASNNGSAGSPYQTIMKAVNSANGGDTILVKNGTYRDAIVIPASLSGTAGNPTVMRGESRDQTIVDGEFIRGYLFISNFAEYFNLENMTFRNSRWPYWNRGAVGPLPLEANTSELLRGWKFSNIVVEKSEGTGLSIGKTAGAIVENCILQDNFQNGMDANAYRNVRVTGCILRRNNAGWTYNPWAAYMATEPVQPDYHVSLDPTDGKYYVSVGFGAGGFKIGCDFSDTMLIENCESYENSGPSIWFDGDYRNVTIRNCTVHDNFDHQHNEWGNYPAGGTGIMFEASRNGPFLVEGCYIYNNEAEDFNLCESSNGIIRNCTFSDDGNGPQRYHVPGTSRFTFRDGWSVGGRSPIRNIAVSDNVFQNMLIECRHRGDIGDNWGPDSLANRNISFTNNRWEGTEPWIGEWEGTSDRNTYGLVDMRIAWGTFFTDTYQTEVTVNREDISPAYCAAQTRISPFVQSAYIFDMRGRRLPSRFIQPVAGLPTGVHAIRLRGIAPSLQQVITVVK